MTTPGSSRLSGSLALFAAVLLGTALAGERAAVAAGGAPALYTSKQAASGEKLYAQHCALCHGDNLQGGNGPPLSGQNMKTLGEKTHLTVGDMFGYMTTNMPMNAPASLKHDQYVDITAYILKKNGYPSGSKPLTYNEAMHSKQKMTSLK